MSIYNFCLLVRNLVSTLSVLHPFFFSGKLGDLYKKLCSLETSQSSVNPENKSVYGPITGEIKEMCMRFSNESSAVKIHLPKAQAKSRQKKQVKPKSEEPED